MKKTLVLLGALCIVTAVFAFDYVPKNANENPFGKNNRAEKNVQKPAKPIQPQMREITTIDEYFKYLPAEVHRNWTPYKSETNYEVTVQFKVHRDGTISNVQIIGTNCPSANASVLNAVKAGAPYQPLPKSFTNQSVIAQVVLEYHKQ